MLLPGFVLTLVLATLLCSLVAGFLFAFAAVVMPGLRALDDAGFLRAFQAIDRVIQNNQPLFVVVWAGSVLVLLTAAVMGVWALSGADRLLVIVAASVYLIGVQAPTVAVNLPMNSMVQRLDPAAMTVTACSAARQEFEPRWNRWNEFRTACAVLVSILLMLLLIRI